MFNHSPYRPQPHQESSPPQGPTDLVDYSWFDSRFEKLLNRFSTLETVLTTMEQKVLATNAVPEVSCAREYYSVSEFATEVERGEYTVREWCRLARIHAEKCESGRGDAKSWKIPVDELQRYRDHGLLPLRYLR
ncbi:hypothetical protein Pla110_24640 [Polystyrenella longa]|uniref:Helix-turn-helix domain protein n=1 Tax=Polystyrenella longa TaxID=2528007 RepID=A0A518CNB9_9PLAN|nr:hypothetical protein [Polystyrenella longa]QDU80731.1 hypothetical protein Pla110_24640 [Polystyrenella longa]